jgi:bifunctional isochorismate lyase/aryl carrier protein
MQLHSAWIPAYAGMTTFYETVKLGECEMLIKKEVYFTRDNIRGKSVEMLEDLMYLRRRMPFVADQSALLILDMQKYFFHEASHAFIPSSIAIIDGINRLVRAFSGHGRPVIVTRHINTPQNAGRMSTWWHEILTEDNPMSQLIDELECDITPAIKHIKCHAGLDPASTPILDSGFRRNDGVDMYCCRSNNTVCLHKGQYDAFHETPLMDTLTEKDVRQIVICGVMTHLCCETTARSAFVRGIDVFFAIDGTATYNEAFHRATLLNLSHGFAQPVLIEEIIAGL